MTDEGDPSIATQGDIKLRKLNNTEKYMSTSDLTFDLYTSIGQ